MNILAIIKAEDLEVVDGQLQEIEEFERPTFGGKRVKDEQHYLISGYASCPQHIKEVLESIEEVECIEAENMIQWLVENGYNQEEVEV